MEGTEILERLEAAAILLEKTLHRLDETAAAATAFSGEVERISATVEAAAAAREAELSARLATMEQELAELKAAAQSSAASVRHTLPSGTAEMLAKHGIGDGPVDVKTLDAALGGLSLEQRIAVKSQLLRAGAIA